jgi:hypothetical protein
MGYTIPGPVNVNKKRWKTTMLLMGKSTISTWPFFIAILTYQRVNDRRITYFVRWELQLFDRLLSSEKAWYGMIKMVWRSLRPWWKALGCWFCWVFWHCLRCTLWGWPSRFVTARRRSKQVIQYIYIYYIYIYYIYILYIYIWLDKLTSSLA